MKKEFITLFSDFDKIETDIDKIEQDCKDFREKGKDFIIDSKVKERVSNIKPIPAPKSLYPILNNHQKELEKIWGDKLYEIELDSDSSIQKYEQSHNQLQRSYKPHITFRQNIQYNTIDSWEIDYIPANCDGKNKSIDGIKCMKGLRNNIDFMDKLLSDNQYLTQILKQNIESNKKDKEN